jgi:hypothetical protein
MMARNASVNNMMAALNPADMLVARADGQPGCHIHLSHKNGSIGPPDWDAHRHSLG